MKITVAVRKNLELDLDWVPGPLTADRRQYLLELAKEQLPDEDVLEVWAIEWPRVEPR